MKNINFILFAFSVVICLSCESANAQCSTAWTFSNYQSCGHNYSPVIYNYSCNNYSMPNSCRSYSPITYNTMYTPSNASYPVAHVNHIPQANNASVSRSTVLPAQNLPQNAVPVGSGFFNYTAPTCQGGNCSFR